MGKVGTFLSTGADGVEQQSLSELPTRPGAGVAASIGPAQHTESRA